MPASAPALRPTVLLLAGDVRAEWARALREGGFDVRESGWLEAVTAARVERPDAVVVSADLPDRAPFVLTGMFRGASDLATVPFVLAGISAEDAEERMDGPFRPHAHVPPPVAPGAVGDAVREAIRVAGAPPPRSRGQVAGLSLTFAGILLLCLTTVWSGLAGFSPAFPRLGSGADAAFLLGAFVLTAAGVALSLAAAPRPLSLRARRRALGWLALLSTQVGNALGGKLPLLLPAGASLACAAGIGWAWLGLRARPPPTTGWRRWYQFLLGLLAVLGAAPWIAFALRARG